VLDLSVVGEDNQEAPLHALFDTGADVTLVEQAEMQRLDITLRVCGPMPHTEVDGSDGWRPFSVLHAKLTDKDLYVPVMFIRADDPPGRALFGRVGLADQLRVTSDPATKRSRFEWIASDPFETTEFYRREWRTWLRENPEGYDPARWGGVDNGIAGKARRGG
jgi:hypothetical protein